MTTVTRTSLQVMLDNPNQAYVAKVIGRALWALFQYQTYTEQNANDTHEHNNVGFNSADGKSGSLTAKYWKKHGTLLEWQMDKWTKKNGKGFSRLSKYHRQLNRIAESK